MRSSCSLYRRANGGRFMGLQWIFVHAIVGSVSLAILWAASVSAQIPGFLSLNCGGTNNFTDKNGIVWVPDTPYIFTGSVSQVPASAQQEEPLKSLRFFSGSRKKNCYILPVTRDGKYLLRLTFFYANYDKLGKPPSFDIQFNGNFLLTVSFADANIPVYYEFLLAAPANTISICLAKSTPTDNPFISTLELRQLEPSMYSEVLQETKLLGSYARTSFGSVSTDDKRYPLDSFDRIWQSDIAQLNVDSFMPLSTNHSVSLGPNFNKPPSAVMMTARTTANSSLPLRYPFGLPTTAENYYICFSFAEIANLAPTDARIFNINLTNGIDETSLFYESLNVQQLATAAFESAELCANYTSLQGPVTFTFTPTPASTLGPIVNAAEIYLVSDILTVATENTDVKALEALKSSFSLTSWTGDPCLPAYYTWDWLDCSSSSPPRVTALRLSNMKLKGVIPPSLSQMTALTDIWLDNNNIIGTIPDFSALTNLQTLHLQNNSLTGRIPQSFSQLQNLQELFLQDNNLSGPVPTKLGSAPGLTFRFSGNPNLCLPDNTSCLSPQPSPPSPIGKTKRNITPVVVGVVIGVVALILIAALVVIRVRRADAKRLKTRETPLSQLSTASTGLINHKDPPKQTQLYTFEQIRIATQNFQKKIGQGGFGPVYFGSLADGQEVAVKMLSSTSNQGQKEFFNEVDLLSRVHHKNLLSLIGYCYESKQQILVYEYMPNGTLRENLYGPMVSRNLVDWKTRLNIALNAAQGLEYLHTGCSPTIIHRDVKSNNILLNKNFMAKVADFGLSKLALEEDATHISTTVKGTRGYLDPEYYTTNQLTEKSDVYSFGVVLLEIICGRLPINPQLSRPELNLVEWVWNLLQEGRIHDIVDPALGQNYSTEAMWKVIEIAMMSVELHVVNRPTMSEVVNELKEAIHLEKGVVVPISNVNAESPFLANQAQVFQGR